HRMVVEALVRHRLTAWVLVLTTQALVLMTGCGRSAPAASQSGTAVVIFIDFSASVTGEDRASFRRAIEAELLPSLSAVVRLLVAQKRFYDETRRKVLILMSDMIEDSPPYNFEKVSWSPATTEKTLSELDAKGLIPKLAGVCIYVSGASAASAELAENIGRFWQAYFRRAGADMEPSRYAHVLLHWPPSNSCHSTT